MECDKVLLRKDSDNMSEIGNKNKNTNNSTTKYFKGNKSDDKTSLTSDQSFEDNERLGCCSVFSVWPWKKFTKPKCERLLSKGEDSNSSTFYRNFNNDHDSLGTEISEPMSNLSPNKNDNKKGGLLRPERDLVFKNRQTISNGQLTATRTPFTSNQWRHGDQPRMRRSSKHKSAGSLTSGQLSGHMAAFNEFQSDSDEGLSIDLHDLEKMASWRYSLDTHNEGWWYDYDDFPMMDESCTTLCNQRNSTSRESIPIWERDIAGNIILRRLKKQRRHSSNHSENGRKNNPQSQNSNETSPTESSTSDKSSASIEQSLAGIHKPKTSRSVSVRSEDVTLDVVREEDVFSPEGKEDDSDPKATLAVIDDSFDSEAELLNGESLSDDVTSLSMEEHALHSSGNYTSSEDEGFLPFELQDEVAVIDELTRRADVAEELDYRNLQKEIRINTRSLYDEIYEEDYNSSSGGEEQTGSSCRYSDIIEEETNIDEADLEDTADEPLIGSDVVLQISALQDIEEEDEPAPEEIDKLTPDGTDESSVALQRRLSTNAWHRSATVRRLTSSQSDPTGSLHLMAMENARV